MLVVAVAAAEAEDGPPDAARPPAGTDTQWPRGLATTPDFFPVAVWLQAPRQAARYREIGINLYVGLWQGPTAEQLAELRRHQMRVICAQNELALARLEDATIVGWMHGDEPDNAQSLGAGKGYGPPIAPQAIVDDYRRIVARDPSRPVFLNLGQGVAWDDWHGRGVRTRHPEDYPEYVRGADIVSFDIYPVVHDRPAVRGRLWYVARGVERLRTWAAPRPVWSCIECTQISDPQTRPTPAQVKAEVWMALIHGARGLIYFCHQFAPQFREAALLADPEMAAAVGRINRQIHALAPVLNTPPIPQGVAVTAEPAELPEDHVRQLGSGPIAAVARRYQGDTYVFAVRMHSAPARATLLLPGWQGRHEVEVIDEGRTLTAEDGRFRDTFAADEVHLYRLRAASSSR